MKATAIFDRRYHAVIRTLATLFLIASIGACSRANEGSGAKTGSAAVDQPKPGKAESGATGTITANPNPIRVCDGSGMGVATLSWSVTGAEYVEVHVGSPGGGLLTYGGSGGSASTGKWVGDGTVFYLQDVTGKRPATEANTISSIRVRVTSEGCP